MRSMTQSSALRGSNGLPRMAGLGVVMRRAHRQDATNTPGSTARRNACQPVGRSPAQSTALRGEDGLARVRAGHAQHDAKHCFARLERPATDGRPGGGNEKNPSAGRHQFAPIKANKPVTPALGVVSGRAHRQDATSTPSSTARRNAAGALRERQNRPDTTLDVNLVRCHAVA